MQRLQCPNCKQEGVLQWKETITKAKGRMYHYKKLYVYHQHPKEHPEKPKWCYLTAEHTRALKITEDRGSITQNLTQNNSQPEKPNLSPNQELNTWASSSGRIEHQPPKLGVVGSNPTPPATDEPSPVL